MQCSLFAPAIQEMNQHLYVVALHLPGVGELSESLAEGTEPR